jgi:NADH:ubiquinone oxidoreductase subunit F (NADH-binding)
MSVMTVATTERLLPVDRGAVLPLDLAGHLANHGALAVPVGDDPSWKAGMFRAVAESGLLGRGGAGFPAAAKWDAVRLDPRRPMVVVNAMEGEPASDKDRVLLTYSPHLVLDGAEVAAAVMGASEIVICVSDDNRRAASSIETAIGERRHAGIAGRRTSVQVPPGRYVTGEESALVSWLNHRRALPLLRVDKSVPLSVGRRPALVHNAETLAQIALIARHGPEWFRRVGTPEAPGSTLITVTGAVRSPGVVEVGIGTPVVEILRPGGVDGELSAGLVGG